MLLRNTSIKFSKWTHKELFQIGPFCKNIAIYNFPQNALLCKINGTPYLNYQNNLPKISFYNHKCYVRTICLFNSRLSKSNEEGTNKEATVSYKEKLKRAIKEYGTTVIVFHVGISLVSLGLCYILVSSGIDMGQILVSLGLGNSAIAANASTFVTAYAIHKVFAPVRISITLAATPFIVRYLRRIGFLKKPN